MSPTHHFKGQGRGQGRRHYSEEIENGISTGVIIIRSISFHLFSPMKYLVQVGKNPCLVGQCGWPVPIKTRTRWLGENPHCGWRDGWDKRSSHAPFQFNITSVGGIQKGENRSMQSHQTMGNRYLFLPHTLLCHKPISPTVRQLLLQWEMLLTYQPRTPRNVRQGIPGVPSPSHEGARGQGLTGERKWTSCDTKGWMTRKWMLTFSHLLFAPPTGWQKPWQSFLPGLSMSYVFGKGGLLGWGGGVLVKEWTKTSVTGLSTELNQHMHARVRIVYFSLPR